MNLFVLHWNVLMGNHRTYTLAKNL